MFSPDYYEAKNRVHGRVIDVLDMSAMSQLEPDAAEAELKTLIAELLDQDRVPLNYLEREQFVIDVRNEVLGMGPLEALLHDPTVSDILVNGSKRVYVERHGKLELTEIGFNDDGHLRRIIEKIVSGVGRRLDESTPMVDARLSDGSRVNAIIPPLAIDGPCLSIRKFAVERLQIDHLIAAHTLTEEMAEFLQGAVQARLNILVSGGTGSGKTTLLNVLSGFIPATERIVTIEDSAELQLHQVHVVRLETRVPNIEGKGEITQHDLVRNSLRMRPDRIILGEVRGPETLDMLQAMNTGHDGSLSTIHANSPRDAMTRVETMVAMAGLSLSTSALRYYVSSALDLIVQVARLSDGSRRVMSLQEVVGMQGDVITLQEIFAFKRTTMDEEGRIHGKFVATGVGPTFMDRFEAAGIGMSRDMFQPGTLVEC